MSKPSNRRLAKVDSVSLGFEDRAGLTTLITMSYGGQYRQGLPVYAITPVAGEWITRLLQAFGVEHWEELPGRIAWVVLEDSLIVGIEPLEVESGKPFMFSEVML